MDNWLIARTKRPLPMTSPHQISEIAAGRVIYAAAIIVFGVQCLVFSHFIAGLQPVPQSSTHVLPWAWANGAILIGCGLALLVRQIARVGALILAGLFSLSILVLHAPLLAANLKNQADGTFHALTVVAGALVLATPLRRAATGNQMQAAGHSPAARLIFGLCAIGHGVMHFVFFKFTADFVPAWIPMHGFWAGATGAAQVVAGLAILSGVLARLAAILLAVMYGSWVLLVHVPRIFAAPASHVEWTSAFIALALSGTALLVAGTIGKPPRYSKADPA